ncbi:unnamed protein product [Caenorhabditis nigoni]
MLKFLILLAVLLNFSACRSVNENYEKLCEAEAERFRFCTETSANVTSDAHKKLVESSSTISPIGSQVGGEFKKSLKCIGDLECKGQWKRIKFQLDAFDFYTDRKIEAQECIKDKDISQSLQNCVTQFPIPKGFSSTVVPCVKKVLEGTECSTKQKVKLEKGALAVADFYELLEMVVADESFARNFDLKFDPGMYGL